MYGKIKKKKVEGKVICLCKCEVMFVFVCMCTYVSKKEDDRPEGRWVEKDKRMLRLRKMKKGGKDSL